MLPHRSFDRAVVVDAEGDSGDHDNDDDDDRFFATDPPLVRRRSSQRSAAVWRPPLHLHSHHRLHPHCHHRPASQPPHYPPPIHVNANAAQLRIHAMRRQEQVARTGDGPVEHPAEAGRLRRVRSLDGVSVRGCCMEIERGACGCWTEGE